jgi:hypothetical protein
MRFTILQLLFAVAAIGSAVGITARDGISVACVLAVIVLLSIVSFVRARKRWPTSNRLQKLYAVATTVASCAMLGWLIYSIGTSASLARERNTRHLQTALAQEPRFSGVRVEYSERKIEALWVDGTVSTENDFQELRKRISQYDWRYIDGIHWDVAVAETKQSYDGWDADLFGDGKPTR